MEKNIPFVKRGYSFREASKMTEMFELGKNLIHCNVSLLNISVSNLTRFDILALNISLCISKNKRIFLYG